MKRLLGAIAAALLLGGCGGQACACSGIGTIQVTPRPLQLTAANDGQTMVVQRGSIVEVALKNSFGPPGSSLTWDVSSSDSSIVLRTSTHTVPEASPSSLLERSEVYVADFRAQGDGTAQIIGQGHRTCEAMNPAFCQQAHYTVTIQVTG